MTTELTGDIEGGCGCHSDGGRLNTRNLTLIGLCCSQYSRIKRACGEEWSHVPNMTSSGQTSRHFSSLGPPSQITNFAPSFCRPTWTCTQAPGTGLCHSDTCIPANKRDISLAIFWHYRTRNSGGIVRWIELLPMPDTLFRRSRNKNTLRNILSGPFKSLHMSKSECHAIVSRLSSSFRLLLFIKSPHRSCRTLD